MSDTPTTPTVRIIEVRYFGEDVYDGSIPRECYENAHITDYEVDDVDEAVRVLQREGLSFAATGNDWAANPDGSYIADYATDRRVETTGHLYALSSEQIAAIIERVG